MSWKQLTALTMFPSQSLTAFDVNERDAAQAVRSLNVDFVFAHGDTGAQHIGHGA